MKINVQDKQISIYKIGYKAISLMVFLCQCQYYKNINYYDLLGSILYVLNDKLI